MATARDRAAHGFGGPAVSREMGAKDVNVTLPYPPTANTYYRHVGYKTLISAKGRQYRVQVELACLVDGVRPLSGPVALTLRFYRPRRIGDLDNMFKPLLDAMKGYAYADDSQVVELHAYRFENKAWPRVEVTIEAAE
ncbi:MAG TPA: RusA family crossover junction endodeoxyribonuclease [Chloroflexota bacterium]|nr:RusA family crossover junction endodeoxyribonuclease [Chloroflexota bacterium]